MKMLSVLIKPASASCNLHCKYCFYIDEAKNRDTNFYGIMKNELVDELISRIDEHFDHKEGIANISFQGGEPTMAGLDYFKYFIETVKKYPNIKPNYSIQTNGTLINEDWSKFFKENKFLIGVSLDGFKDNTDYFRVDNKGVGAFEKINNGIKLLDKYHNEYNILTVLTRKLAAEPERLFEFYKIYKFKYIQLIPCLPELNGQDNGMSLTINEYTSFYNRFFDAWKKECLKGNVLSINLFENIASTLSGNPPYQCGMIGRCSVQYVIEANGNVFPCDFYCLDEFLLGNIKENTFAELTKKGNDLFIASSACKKKPCDTCKFIRICNGGCRRQNTCYLNDETCAYQKVLEHIVPEIYEMIRR